jgi:hypothetical protein
VDPSSGKRHLKKRPNERSGFPQLNAIGRKGGFGALELFSKARFTELLNLRHLSGSVPKLEECLMNRIASFSLIAQSNNSLSLPSP